MALKKKLSKADYEKLADHLKPEYVEKNGDYHLDLDDEESGALLRAKDREKELRKEAEAKAKELEARLAEIEGTDARKRGDIETLEKSWKSKLAETEKALLEKLGKKDNYLKSTLVDNVAQQLASKISTSPALIIPHIKARLAADLDGEVPSTKVLDKDGKLSALSLDDLQNEFVTNPDFGAIIIGSKASGSRATSQNVNQTRVFGSNDKPANLANMKPSELVAHIAAQKQGA